MKKNMRWLLAMLLVLGLLAVPMVALGAPGPIITQPNGGEYVARGTEYTVEWTDYAEATFQFYLSTDSGANYDTNLGSGYGGSFTFTVPQISTNTARIKMTGIIGMTKVGIGSMMPVYGSDESDADFRIGFMVVPIEPIAIITIPAIPENLVVGTNSSISIRNLTWEDKSGNETGFDIYRKNESDLLYEQIGTVDANVTSYKDEEMLTYGDTYIYRVTAYNAEGSSAYSNIAEYEVVSMPMSPAFPVGSRVTINLRINDTTYQVNGVDHEMDTAPVIRDGRTLLPVRYIADPLGADVGWVGGEQKATVSLGSTYLELWIDNPMAEINSVPTPIDAFNDDVTPIIVSPGRTMLPLRFISEALGCQVFYHTVDRSIEVIYPAP